MQAQLVKAYSKFFKSPDGKVVLEDLSKRFYDVDLSAKDETTISIKAGSHRVIHYIKRIIDAGVTK